MNSPWQDRLATVVFPAIERGVWIYAASGEIHPGHGLKEQASEKPNSLPAWINYEAASGGRPATRWMSLLHKPRNPQGKAFASYTSPRNSDLGVPLCVPIGEGLDLEQGDDLLHRDILASIAFKPVKVIALGRTRMGEDDLPYSEPVLFEIYDEAGRLIWHLSNWGTSLEQAVEQVLAGSTLTRTSLVEGAPTPAAGPAPFMEIRQGPHEGKGSISSNLREKTMAQFDILHGRGLEDEEIVAEVASVLGVSPVLVRRTYAAWQAIPRKDSAAKGHQDLVLAAVAQAQEFGFGGTDLEQIVVELLEEGGHKIPHAIVRRLIGRPSTDLAGPESLPASTGGHLNGSMAKSQAGGAVPALPPGKLPQIPMPSLGKQALKAGRTISGDSRTILEVEDLSRTKLTPKQEATVATEREIIREAADRLKANIDDFKAKTIAYLKDRPRFTATPGEIRAHLGLPTGGSSTTRNFTACFRRCLLDKLVAAGTIKLEGSTRNSSYRLIQLD